MRFVLPYLAAAALMFLLMVLGGYESARQHVSTFQSERLR